MNNPCTHDPQPPHTQQSLRGGAARTTDFAAWAGEEDKAAWAGIDDPLRVSANAVRVKDGLAPLAPEPTLSKAALQLAQDLVSQSFSVCDW